MAPMPAARAFFTKNDVRIVSRPCSQVNGCELEICWLPPL